MDWALTRLPISAPQTRAGPAWPPPVRKSASFFTLLPDQIPTPTISASTSTIPSPI